MLIISNQTFVYFSKKNIYYSNVNKEMHEIEKYICSNRSIQCFRLSAICCSPTYVCRVRNSQISG